MKEFTIEEALQQVEHYVRNTGRTSVQDIERVLQRMQRNGNGTEKQIILLLSCCGRNCFTKQNYMMKCADL